MLKTDDGVMIEWRNRGIRHGPPEVMPRLAHGEPVKPSAYYVRTAKFFKRLIDATPGSIAAFFLCSGARYPDSVIVKFYEIT